MKIELRKMLKRLSFYNIKKAFYYLRKNGFQQLYVKVAERFKKPKVQYQSWYDKNKLTDEEYKEQCNTQFDYAPCISIVVPVYRTKKEFLQQMLESVCMQSYTNWELCLADGSGDNGVTEAIWREYADKDDRIKYSILETNGGITANTNEAIRLATGEYVGFLDHDDLLAPNALHEIVSKLQDNPNIEIFYTDEDKVTQDLEEYFQPNFKPEFDPVLLRSNNYICHFFVVKKVILDKVGGIRGEYEGAQDYDLILRCTEYADKIVHIPKMLYHWRVHKDSTSENPESKLYAFEAGIKAIKDHLKRCGENGHAEHTANLGFYRVLYEADKTKVSIILYHAGEKLKLINTIHSIQQFTDKSRYELIIAAREANLLKNDDELQRKIENINIKYIDTKGGEGISAYLNKGAAAADGKYLLFMRSGIQVSAPKWIDELTGNCRSATSGIAGGKLLDKKGCIVDAGRTLNFHGTAGRRFQGEKNIFTGYLHKAAIQQRVSAVSYSFFIVKSDIFKSLKGFQENMKNAYFDVDFCLRASEHGWYTVYTPYAVAYIDDIRKKLKKSKTESQEHKAANTDELHFREKWKDYLNAGDPYYPRALSLKGNIYEIEQM